MKVTRGFTLVEIVAVLAFMAVALAGYAALFSNNSFGMDLSLDLQRASQYAQECGERVMMVRRTSGFGSTSISTTMCDSAALGAMDTGFTRTTTVSSTYTGDGTTTCPSAATCRDIAISVVKGSATSTIAITLASY